MTALIIIFCIVLLAVILVQYGKFRELTAKIRGEEEAQNDSDKRNSLFGLVFMVLFLSMCVLSALYYKNWMLWYGPHQSASIHGHSIDSLFNYTTAFTAVVFFACHIVLFWFAYKYRYNKDRKSLFLSHDNTLEAVWTVIPALVMCFLVVQGLVAWNEVMADVEEGEDHIEIEAMGQQWGWLIRYPGEDGLLGTRDYRRFNSVNPMAQVWEDEKNLDDFQPSEIVLPVGKKVRVRITAKDVLHNFALPHFRVKMDAIPGIPTHFVFTPEITTADYRLNLKEYEDYQALSDPDDPESPPLWESFNFELACAELCGKGHYSMKRIVRIVEQEEYDAWVAKQTSWYEQSVRGTEYDPYGDLSAYDGDLPEYLVNNIKEEFNTETEAALLGKTDEDRTVVLKHVYYSTGSYDFSGITERYYLSNLVNFMEKYPDAKIQLSGHTDSDGDETSNQILSENRAGKIAEYLAKQGIDQSRFTAVGYGEERPIDTNETAEGKANNRRTEFTILASDRVVEAAEESDLTEESAE